MWAFPVFHETALRVFRFLEDEHEFQRLLVDDHPPRELFVTFAKGDVAVTPFGGVGEPLDVLFQATSPEGRPYWGKLSRLSSLERLRCPHERMPPQQRLEGPCELVFEHDARVIRGWFPDVLAGRFDLLQVDFDEARTRLSTDCAT